MVPETEWAGLCEMQLKLLYGLVLAGTGVDVFLWTNGC